MMMVSEWPSQRWNSRKSPGKQKENTAATWISFENPSNVGNYKDFLVIGSNFDLFNDRNNVQQYRCLWAAVIPILVLDRLLYRRGTCMFWV
jgi:hypothetical protein